eukprot:13267109-Heterocapsa_arctica.AAC.1
MSVAYLCYLQEGGPYFPEDYYSLLKFLFTSILNSVDVLPQRATCAGHCCPQQAVRLSFFIVTLITLQPYV